MLFTSPRALCPIAVLALAACDLGAEFGEPTDLDIAQQPAATVDPYGRERLQLDWFKARVEAMKVLHGDIREARARADKVWAEARVAHGEAALKEMAVRLKGLMTQQSAMDLRLTAMLQGDAFKWLKKVQRAHDVAVRILGRGDLSPENVRALEQYFLLAAVGMERDAAEATAMKELLAAKPEKYKDIINADGDIIQLPASCFRPRGRLGRAKEVYRMRKWTKPATADRNWDIYIQPQWPNDDYRYSALVEVFPVEPGKDVPEAHMLASERIYNVHPRDGGRTEHRNRIVIVDDLDHVEWLYIRITGGIHDGGYSRPLRPKFYLYDAGLHGATGDVQISELERSGKLVPLVNGVGREFLKRQSVPQKGPMAFKAAPGKKVAGGIRDMIAFAYDNEFNLDHEAIDIIDHAFVQLEKKSKENMTNTMNEMITLRDALTKFTQDLAEKRLGK